MESTGNPWQGQQLPPPYPAQPQWAPPPPPPYGAPGLGPHQQWPTYDQFPPPMPASGRPPGVPVSRAKVIVGIAAALIVVGGIVAWLLVRPSAFERADPGGYAACKQLAEVNRNTYDESVSEVVIMSPIALSADRATSADIRGTVSAENMELVADRYALTSACRDHGMQVPDPIAAGD